MVPEAFTSFFSASAGAGAALAGLLFLAITVGPITTVGRRAPVERRSVATSAFVALINAFLLSLGALLPGGNYGVVAVSISMGSLFGTVRIGRELVQGQRSVAVILRRLVLVLVSALIYGTEAAQAFQLLAKPGDSAPVAFLANLLLPVYTIAVLRAWELVGAERHGLLARFSPLRDLESVPESIE